MLRSHIGVCHFNRFFGILLILFAGFLSACSETADTEPPQPADAAPGFTLTEGSGSKTEAPKTTQKVAEGSGGAIDGHPDVQESEKQERRVYVPKGVEGQWKAVKILVRYKADESKNELKTVAIGSSFMIENSGIQVTVGPFFPNFVMDQGTYTSMNNKVINPAVQLVVEENGKTLYKGWTFAKYPTMYAFEHEEYALELKDQIPVGVS
ncbi:MAG: hypothetical protein NPINA01_17800 [Nitrospinaceae bacterium]|nr:MAG: hypothetical protein NPINA01_17800 [Nitrospinaceae bacterium]